VLAHPVQLCCENDAQLETVVKNLIDLGLAGVEVMHSDHTPAQVERYEALARKYKLLMTGGSDYHGRKKDGLQLGMAAGKRVPREYYDTLVARGLPRTVR
jgi:3',5'-nucleoside bisphosphate phosphatase